MLTCECGKQFLNIRQLNGHKSVHTRGENYRNSRASEVIRYKCLNCSKEVDAGASKVNKYCSTNCQREYQSADKIRQWLEEGKDWNYGVPPWARRTIAKLRGDGCEICGVVTHNNLPLQLECDHIDGNHTNNKIENLRLICPNCHSQTSTYKAKNMGNGRKSRRTTDYGKTT
jgi:hypothetical protein